MNMPALIEFFNINVPLWQWWLSQAIGLVALVLLVICWQTRDKIKTLSFVTGARIASGAATALLGNWVLAAFFFVSAVRSLSFIGLYVAERRGHKAPQWLSVALLVFFLAATATSMWFTSSWWLDYVLLGVCIVFVFTEWARGIHVMRGVQVVMSGLMFANNWFANMHIMGMVKAAAVIGSIAVFYIRAFVNKKKEGSAQPCLSQSEESLSLATGEPAPEQSPT